MGDITSDMVNSFFNLSKPIPAKPKVVVNVQGPRNTRDTSYKPEFKLTKKTRNNSQIQWYMNSQEEDGIINGNDLSNLDLNPTELPPPDPDAPVPAAMKGEEEAHIYEHYTFDHEYSPDLPITKYHEEIVNTIESNSVCVVHGPTGSGKTTQVPQYILDNYAKDKRYCNIVVTQPRRIAATSIAKRVCHERSCTLGSLVGYQVARDKCISEDTRITYLTTGVLLQKLIGTKNMNEYTHVILDEVHERDQDTDFCLLVVRKLLRSNSRHVKIILMSATLQSNLFSRYFSVPVQGKLQGAPVFPVEGKIFPVEEVYLDHLSTLGPLPNVTLEEPGISQESYELAARLIAALDYWEKNRPSTAATANDAAVDEGEGEQLCKQRGTVLVFLPGLPEIKRMHEVLEALCPDSNLALIPLHSQITIEEQSRVFIRPDSGVRKIILSTNIAESSITVPDIKYVIDFCLTKCLISDPETNYQALQVQWSSKSSCIQRKGRAGRVSSGICYRMVTQEFFNSCLTEFGIPEMQRCPLEQIVLQVKLLDLGEPRAILRLALQPPDLDDIERTVLLLKQVGALTTKMKGGRINPHDGDLTFIGKVLGTLPVDVKIGKLFVLGYVFGCLEECIAIGASLSLKTFFSRQFKEELKTYRNKMNWDSGAFSDCMCSLRAYTEWLMTKENNLFRRGGRGELAWCKEKGIQMGRIREVHELAKELTERLRHFNVRTDCELYRKTNNTREEILILKLVIAGAFYPNYFESADIDEAEATKLMSGHDPFTNVMVRGMPPYGAQYKAAIARLFRDCGKGKSLFFEDTRAYIEFDRTFQSNTSATILPAVYLAIKMRLLRLPLNLYISEQNNQRIEDQMNSIRPVGCTRLRTNRVAASLASGSQRVSFDDIDQPRQVPVPQKGYIEIVVTWVVDAGHFWAANAKQESSQNFAEVETYIGTYQQHEQFDWRTLQVGSYCIVPYNELPSRAKVINIEYEQPGTSRSRNRVNLPYSIKVLFPDYGNIEELSGEDALQQVYKMKPEFLRFPFQAFECELCEISYTSTHGMWSDRAHLRFVELTQSKKLIAKIYSKVHGILRVDLYDTMTEEDIHINQVLIIEGFAQFMEESYASKMARHTAEAMPADGVEEEEENINWYEDDQTLGFDSTAGQFLTKVPLRGPYNPLEMSFSGITTIGRLRTATIEVDSVNSVALNDQPQDTHPRLLVASNIGIKQHGNSVIARDTTLMPNIHGLLAIIALTFSPCAELRTDSRKQQYTGALVGLGYDEKTNQPLLPDHDIELTFDVHIDHDDLVKINSVRTCINLAFGSEGVAAEWGSGAMSRIQAACKENILALVLKRREDKKPISFPKHLRWNLVDPQDVLVPRKGSQSPDDPPDLYQLHNGIAVSGFSVEDEMPAVILEKREKNQNLHELAGRSSEPFPETIVCELCQVRCRHPRGVSLHLNSRCHQEEEAILYDTRP